MTGDQIVTASADAVNLTLDVDGTSTSIALAGATVTDTDNDWILDQGNVMPYMDDYSHTVGGVLIVHYEEPTSYIVGTTLPDTEGAAQNGTFVWGANPTGVAVLLSSLLPVAAYEASPILDASEAMGETIMPPDMFRPEAEMTLAWPWLQGLIQPVAALTDTPVTMFIWYLNGMIVIITIAWVYKNLQNLWMTGLAAVVAIGAGIGMGAWPEWFLLLAVLMIIGAAVMERRPTL